MAKNIGNVYILAIFLIALILFICLRREYDSFETSIPESCGQYGYFPTKYFKAKITLNKNYSGDNLDYVDNMQRIYSDAECKTLGGIKLNDYNCVLLKKTEKDKNGKYDLTKENIKKQFDQVCKGLNKTNTPPPKECSINNKLPGKPSAEFKLNTSKGDVTIEKNTLRLYTMEECSQLGGQFLGLNSPKYTTDEWATQLQKMANDSNLDIIITDDDVNRITKANGVDYGICGKIGKPIELSYSAMCINSADNPLISQVFSVAKSTTGVQDIGKAVIKMIQEQLNI